MNIPTRMGAFEFPLQDEGVQVIEGPDCVELDVAAFRRVRIHVVEMLEVGGIFDVAVNGESVGCDDLL